ncbi:glycosyltransferase family 39 protein [Candidatus Woesebacteria bacterium]|nr:MAG: glycosyltransferase family 39 protein [Candidatus Woesebacteria bacterium]
MKNFVNTSKKYYNANLRAFALPLFFIFAFAFIIRIYSFYPDVLVFDYDQIEDLMHTRKIVEYHDLPVMGRKIYGLYNLRHGVLYFYYNLLPYTLFNAHPVYIAAWNSLINSLMVVVIFIFSKALFKDNKAAYISSLLFAVSFVTIQFTGWISNTTLTLVTVPLYYYFLWRFIQGKKYGVQLSALFLGLALQSQLFMLYLIPATLIALVIFRPRLPTLRTVAISCLLFFLATSTMIVNEIKLKYAGIYTLTHFSEFFNDADITLQNRALYFLNDFFDIFTNSLSPGFHKFGTLVALITITYLIYVSRKAKDKNLKQSAVFVLLFLLSPSLMIIFGYHTQPWFLIGILSAIALSAGYVLSRVPGITPLILLTLIVLSNVTTVRAYKSNKDFLLKPCLSAVLTSQLAVVDFTYQKANGKPFSLNTVSYPLYYNATWSYHYNWYGLRKYGYLPGWLGGDLMDPYYKLPRSANEELMFVVIDTTYRIPEKYKKEIVMWASERGQLINEVAIDGFIIQEWNVEKAN